MAVLTGAVVVDRAAERGGHQLEAVAHAEDGDPGLEERAVQGRRALRVHRRGAAGEDDRARVLRQHLGHRHGGRDDLAVDPGLTDTAGDELGVLRAEVDDEDHVGRGVGGGGGCCWHGGGLPAVVKGVGSSDSTGRARALRRTGAGATGPRSVRVASQDPGPVLWGLPGRGHTVPHASAHDLRLYLWHPARPAAMVVLLELLTSNVPGAPGRQARGVSRVRVRSSGGPPPHRESPP